MIRILTAVAFLCCSAASADEPAPDARPLLTKPGKLLFSEDLSQVPHERDKQNKTRRGWQSGKGKWEIKDGVLVGAEKPEEHHGGMLTKPGLAFHNAAVQVSFRLDGARRITLDANSQALGRIIAVSVSSTELTLARSLAGGDKLEVLNKEPLKLEAGTWYTLLLEIQGRQVVASIDGKQIAFGDGERIDVDKTSVQLRVGGESVAFKIFAFGRPRPATRGKRRRRNYWQRARRITRQISSHKRHYCLRIPSMKFTRRQVLRSAGVALALPCLDAFSPARASVVATQPRRRMVCICAPLGLRPDNFFPEKSGTDYEFTPYLELLKDYRDDFTVISGLSHAGMSSGFAHQSSASFLTGIPGAGRIGFRNSISLDQLAAEHIGGQTRFPSLTLSGDGQGLSWTRTGAIVPADNSPSRVFARLFLEGSADEMQAQVRRLEDGRSILDDVRNQAAGLRSNLGAGDRDKLEEYLTSVRELEQRLVKDEGWFKTPKPKVDAQPPKDIPNAADLIGRTRLLFDLTHLALQTDSTRLVTIMLGGGTTAPPIPGVTLGHHDLSHHGKDPGKLEQLKIIEVEAMKTVRDLLAKLKQSQEDGANLLDRTTVFLGSNLGEASSHSVKNLPVLLAGGGFKHGQHLPFDPQNPPPLCNLYVSMLQRLGIEADKFSSGTGTLTGLESVG